MTTSYPYLQQAKGLGIALLNMVTNFGTGHAQMEFGFKDELSSIVALADAQAIFNSFSTRLRPYWAPSVGLVSVEVTLWDGTELQQATTNYSTVFGSGSGNPISPNVAVLIQKKSGLIGKENRGRMYMPGFPVNATAAPDSISVTTKGNIDLALEGFLTDIATGGNQMAPWLIRKTDAISPHPPFYDVQVLTLTSETKLATQRRRLRKAAHR